MKRTYTLLALAAVVTALLLLPAGASGQSAPAPGPQATSVPGTLIPLEASGQNEFTAVPSPLDSLPPGVLPSTPTATFVVNYTGFSAEAQAAFQAAVDIWSYLVVSPVPIVVNATWAPAGNPNNLGLAGPSTFWRDFAGAPQAGTFYPVAVANSRYGSDLSPALVDINANFNSTRSDWYLGTSGSVPAGKYDLVSVVLHELGHGLGFLSTFSWSGGIGSWGISAPPYPTAFDPQVVNGAVQQLTTAYANNSAALAGQLTSDNIYFNGTNAVAANGGIRPKIYAPGSWAGGSSMSHFDEATFPAGNANSLMTPMLGSAESIHSPGPVGLGVLKDIGWVLASSGGPATKLAFSGQPASGTVGNALSPLTVQVQDAGSVLVTSDNTTQVTLAKASGPGTLSCAPVVVTGGVASFPSCSVDQAGTYTLQASASPVLTTATTASFVVAVPQPPALPTYNGITQVTQTSLRVNWIDNAANEMGYQVYRIQGLVVTLVPGCSTTTANLTSCVDSGLSPGTYYSYQVWVYNAEGFGYPGTYMAAYTVSTAPAAPTMGSAAGMTSSTIRVQWIDNSRNETGFKVYEYNGGVMTLVGTVGANQVSYTASGLAGGTVHVYVVTAYNGSGETYANAGIFAQTLP